MSVKIAIDIGNSRIKVGCFSGNLLQGVRIYAHDAFPGDLHEWVADMAKGRKTFLGVGNVGRTDAGQKVAEFCAQTPNSEWMNILHDSPLPVAIRYATPDTLGMDRVAGAIGAWELAGGGPVLSIDAGTAITYDFIDGDDTFCGGGIAPGMRLRFRALNDHTAALPLVTTEGPLDLVGNTTENAIRSGVIMGLIAEVDGIVARYRERFGADVQAVITGGDADFLGNHLKNINFVDPMVLLKGINRVLNYNFELNG